MLTSLKIKRIFYVSLFAVLLGICFLGIAWPQDVRVLSMRGPVATAKISPSSVTATAYRMNIAGQKSINFKSNANVVVYLASSTNAANDGWPLLFKGDSVTFDLVNGTTVYLKAAAVSSDVRVLVAR